jgi:hypothetical protein
VGWVVMEKVVLNEKKWKNLKYTLSIVKGGVYIF